MVVKKNSKTVGEYPILFPSSRSEKKFRDLLDVNSRIFELHWYDQFVYDSSRGSFSIVASKISGSSEIVGSFTRPLSRDMYLNCIARDRDVYSKSHLSSLPSFSVMPASASHRSNRGMNDSERSLVCSFMMKIMGQERDPPRPFTIFFAGDTAYDTRMVDDWKEVLYASRFVPSSSSSSSSVPRPLGDIPLSLSSSPMISVSEVERSDEDDLLSEKRGTPGHSDASSGSDPSSSPLHSV
ncbi:hypothetical protein ADUPG1_012132, partial [Aduncisulcus paluster]